VLVVLEVLVVLVVVLVVVVVVVVVLVAFLLVVLLVQLQPRTTTTRTATKTTTTTLLLLLVTPWSETKRVAFAHRWSMHSFRVCANVCGQICDRSHQCRLVPSDRPCPIMPLFPFQKTSQAHFGEALHGCGAEVESLGKIAT